MWGGAEMPRLCVDVSCGLCIVAWCFAGMWGEKVGDICLLAFCIWFALWYCGDAVVWLCGL